MEEVKAMCQMHTVQRPHTDAISSADGNKSKHHPGISSSVVYTIAHELHTPLTYILGYAALLHDRKLGELEPEQFEALSVILHHTHILCRTVERLNALLMAKTHMCVFQPLELSHLTMQVIQKSYTTLGRPGLTLRLCRERRLPSVLGDANLLAQAIDCLLDNAVKFTPGEGQIRVSVYSEPGWVCCAVIDTGIGIAQEELARIFDLFYQVDGTSTRQYGGLGLGLAVVKTIVEEHKGEIVVTSQLGKGSQFLIKIPTCP